MKGIKAEQRLYLTADREQVVPEGDPEAAFLLAASGQIIPQKEADRLGFLPEDFPGYESLVEAGILTVSAVREIEDLTAIKGIGKKIAEEIQQQLKG